MATFKYTIASGCDTGLMQKHSHSSLISDINNSAKNNMPRGAVISSARVVLVMSHNGGLGSADLNVWLCNNESDNSGENLISGSTNKNDDKTYQKDISSKITKNYPFTFNTSYSRIAVYYKSTTHRHYRDRDFYVEYTYSVPTYTVTVNTGTGGTVTGSGTYQNQATATVTATPNRGYKFVGWANQSGTITSTVNPYSFTVTANTTFSAVFEPIPIEVTVESYEGQNGATATISGAGQYKFGDTITIKADIPQYHEFFAWYCSSSAGNLVFKENPLVITLNESFVNQGDTSGKIKFSCAFPFTGYILKGNVSPENSGVVGLGYQITEDFTDYWSIPEGGILVGGDNNLFSVEGALVRAVPNGGYEFIQWSDGETANPREANLTGDTTFTAIFRRLPPQFTSVFMTYMDKQISPSNKVICNEGFIISVEVT